MFLALWANPLVRKITIYAAIIAAIFYVLRLYSNRVYSEGFKQGKVAGAIDMERQKQTEWAAKEQTIAESAASLDSEKRSVEADKARLSQDRINLSRSLRDALAATTQRREADYANVVAAVAPGDLDAGIRAISAELAAAVR